MAASLARAERVLATAYDDTRSYVTINVISDERIHLKENTRHTPYSKQYFGRRLRLWSPDD